MPNNQQIRIGKFNSELVYIAAKIPMHELAKL